MIAPPWSLERGATVLPDGCTRFSVWAPNVDRVSVVFSAGGRASEHPLQPGDDASFQLVLPDVHPGTDYLYRLDGDRDRPDPVSRYQPAGVHGPSRVVDADRFLWSDDDWRGLETADLVLYELHVGTFSLAGTFDGVVEALPYLRELGVTAIELMPVAEFPGRRNWGYDGVHPYGPHSAYGGPEGLRRLVNAAHGAGLAVFLDVVYNHLGPEGNYLAEFGPYFTDRYRTPWGQAINFDGPGSDEVRRYFIDNALYWITEYHIDGLRLDAVQTIFDFSAIHILEELAAAVHDQARALGRRVLVIAESDLNDPKLARKRERAGYGLDAMWSDDFHHALHAALTGERAGYYLDFGGVEPLVRALRDRFVLDGRYSTYRGRRHGAPAADLPADRFVVFIQNHDQAGNRAQGERLTQLVPLEQQKLAAALVLLSPYVPLLFMGEEYGELNPFLYFVDHGDPELLEAVRQGRQRELQRFAWQGSVPDPAAQETFNRSRLDRGRARHQPHAQLLDLYRDLVRARRQEAALRPGAARARVESDLAAGWLAIVYEGAGRDLLAVFNLAKRAGTVELMASAGRWVRCLATDEARYAGPGAVGPGQLDKDGVGPLQLAIGGHSAALYAREED